MVYSSDCSTNGGPNARHTECERSRHTHPRFVALPRRREDQRPDAAPDQRGAATRTGLGTVDLAPDRRADHGRLRAVPGRHPRHTGRRPTCRRQARGRRMGTGQRRREPPTEGRSAATREMGNARSTSCTAAGSRCAHRVRTAASPRGCPGSPDCRCSAWTTAWHPGTASPPRPSTSAPAGTGCAASRASTPTRSSSRVTPQAATSPSTCCCNPTWRTRRASHCSHP